MYISNFSDIGQAKSISFGTKRIEPAVVIPAGDPEDTVEALNRAGIHPAVATDGSLYIPGQQASRAQEVLDNAFVVGDTPGRQPAQVKK